MMIDNHTSSDSNNSVVVDVVVVIVVHVRVRVLGCGRQNFRLERESYQVL